MVFVATNIEAKFEFNAFEFGIANTKRTTFSNTVVARKRYKLEYSIKFVGCIHACLLIQAIGFQYIDGVPCRWIQSICSSDVTHWIPSTKLSMLKLFFLFHSCIPSESVHFMHHFVYKYIPIYKLSKLIFFLCTLSCQLGVSNLRGVYSNGESKKKINMKLLTMTLIVRILI